MAKYGDSFWDMVKDIKCCLNEVIEDNPNYKFTNRDAETLYQNILIYTDKGISDLKHRLQGKKMKKLIDGDLNKKVKVEALDFNSLEIVVNGTKNEENRYLYYTKFTRDNGSKLIIRTYGKDKEATDKKHEKIVKVLTKGSKWVRGRTCLFPA